MADFGKTIRIYLKDGVTSGIKMAEIVNNTIQAISCSRLRLEELAFFPQTKKPGVYFLFGQDDESSKPKAYIGEAENTYERLQDHIIRKDFWNEVIFFVSKDENLTKAHVKYLESRLIQLAKSSDRYKIENFNDSQAASLPLGDKDAMEEFLTHMRILLSVLNYPILEEPLGGVHSSSHSGTATMLESPENNVSEKKRELSLSISGLRANALQTDEGFIVLAGSQAAKNNTDALQPGYRAIRASLISSAVLKIEGNKYVFQENTLFKSPSAAAAVIIGYNINGLESWKDSSGKTLNELEKT